MKKLLLSCFLALGVGASAQYNYVGDFEGDASIYGQFGNGTITAAAACTGALGAQIASPNTASYQSGWMMQLDKVSLLDPAQKNNGQAATVTINYKKAVNPVGTLYPMLFIYLPDTDQWSIVQIGAGVPLAAPALTTCSTITGTIPAGVMEEGTIYAVGAWYVRGSSSGNIYFDNISIVQDVVTTAPACTTITSPAAGSTIGSGSAEIVWAVAPTATKYKLTVGTTSGGSDVFNGTITGGATSQYVSVEKNKTYYAKVVPTNASGDATGCTGISFSTDSSVSYCAATSVNVDEKITKVVVADINQTTASAAGYGDYTSVKGHMIQGKSYVITNTIAPFYNGDKTAVWIDFNQDGKFTDDERTILSAAAASTGTIVVPAGALLGDTRMRVRVDYNATPVACGAQASGYGQAFDFTVNIAALAIPSCTTITNPANDATGVTAPNVTINWNEDAMAFGYKVYVGTTPGGINIVNGTVANTTSFALTGLDRNTTYYAKVVPTNTLGDATGCSEISFTTSADWTYCAATHSTVNADRISNVLFAGIDNASTATTIVGGYEDFTTVVGTVEKEGVYPMAITVASGNANDKVKVWIDYNQNGIFEDSEMTLLTYGSLTSTTGNITIPADAKYGNTRMRIRLARQASAAAVVACGNIAAQGRTQDYTIKVKEPTAATSSVTKSATSVYPNPFQDVLKISDVKGVKSISVSDVSGRQVKNMKPSAELN
ncbi:GEVED domain-containing protein, partial [Kaistella sp.]|uniref:GEVED domain-containing protein n=1 Tax=Kaistella sp. TaxID=2782235 RepID=UPI003C5D7F64